MSLAIAMLPKILRPVDGEFVDDNEIIQAERVEIKPAYYGDLEDMYFGYDKH